MSTLRALLNGFGTLTFDPNRTLQRARIRMAREDEAQREAWSRGLHQAYQEEQLRAQSPK